jgi:glyoxylase-like metal-dependent hydrolase (beta-lactamase superfamily II)
MQSPPLSSVTAPRLFETSGGARIYQITLEEFPRLWGHVYLVLVDGYRVLIDTGSGFGSSNQQLEDGLQAVGGQAGEPVSLAGLTHVLITHGHIDHFGGLSYVRPRTQALLGVHELDLRNLTNYEERLAVVSRRLGEFLMEAGVSDGRRQELINLYKITKSLYRSVHVDFTYEAAGMRLGPFEMLHTPGHCAGHVVIRLHDVLFSGDHVLDHTSPHQSPEHLTLSTGLDHYLKSLDSLEAWAQGIRLTLGGHEDLIFDLPARLEQIRSLHRQRLAQVLDLLEKPHTVVEVSHSLFGEVHGYNVLLALEEAGAHVEYLYQRGLLGIENLEELENSTGPVPIRYYRLS